MPSSRANSGFSCRKYWNILGTFKKKLIILSKKTPPSSPQTRQKTQMFVSGHALQLTCLECMYVYLRVHCIRSPLLFFTLIHHILLFISFLFFSFFFFLPFLFPKSLNLFGRVLITNSFRRHVAVCLECFAGTTCFVKKQEISAYRKDYVQSQCVRFNS